MEPTVSVSSSPMQCTSLSSTAPIWQDILAQAMTGEMLAAMNYASLAEICDDPAEVADALEHAQGERGHAASFAAEGRKIGVEVTNNVDAKHWKRLREAFLRCIGERDFIACLIVQEIMLESFAVASYSRVGKVGPGSLGQTFARIAAEEEDHVEHAMSILRAERARDTQGFDDKVHRLHLEVMTTLAQMLAKECKDGHCEVCHHLCQASAVWRQPVGRGASRGLVATISEDAGHAGHPRRGDAGMDCAAAGVGASEGCSDESAS